VEPIIVGFTALGEDNEKAAAPIPVRDTLCGLPTALSLIVKEPVRVLLAVGEKNTLTLQLSPTLRVLSLAAQVSVSEKSPPALVEIFVMFSVAVPVLVIVTFWAGLVVPTF
jgi:hypothetical protein